MQNADHRRTRARGPKHGQAFLQCQKNCLKTGIIPQSYHLFSHKNSDVSKPVSYQTILRHLENFFRCSKSYLYNNKHQFIHQETDIAPENRW